MSTSSPSRAAVVLAGVDQIGVRAAAVDLGLANPEPVEIGTGEHQHLHTEASYPDLDDLAVGSDAAAAGQDRRGCAAGRARKARRTAAAWRAPSCRPASHRPAPASGRPGRTPGGRCAESSSRWRSAVASSRPAARARKRPCEDQPDGNGRAVTPPVVLGALDGVAEGVAVVEDLAAAGLPSDQR